MYARILWGRLRLGVWSEYERYYKEHIEPITRGMEGFYGRQLLRSTENPDEGMSLALWHNLEPMEDYARSQQRQKAVHGLEHLYTWEYWISSFEIRSSTVQYPLSNLPYMRMIWGRLRLGTWDEFERYYNDHIGPLTQGMRWFRGRQLLQSLENRDEGISITLWDNLEATNRYDMSPHRQAAAREINHLYTGEYWVRKFELRYSTV